MPTLRNPFRKTGASLGGLEPVNDENSRPVSHPLAERASFPGSKSSISILSLKSKREETNEYKLSVVNDSGIYLPPSPTERKSFWHGSSASVTSSNHRSMLNENEPFMISRESFDSYRRSFDISARSPVVQPGGPPLRKSLDSRVAGQLQSTASEAGEGQRSSTADEHFEDVGLHDEIKPKKKSLFARFAETDHSNPTATPTSPLPHHGFSFPGRKRGHSGQGAELGKIDRSGDSSLQGMQTNN